MKQLSVADMDGTLLDPSSRLTENTVAALKKAESAGVGVTLASGRMPCALRQFVDRLALTAPLICYNGALVADPVTEEELSGFPLECGLAREVIAFCEGMSLHVQAYRGDAFVCAEANAFARDYQAFLNCPVKLQAVGAPLSGYIDFDTPKLLAIDTPERVAALLPRLKEKFDGRVKVATSQPRFVEFVSPAAGKAAALERLCQLTGVSRDEVYAFGDGLNDLDMIQWAGHSYAMANGHEKVIEAADEVAPSNAEDGVARMVRRLMEQGVLGGK